MAEPQPPNAHSGSTTVDEPENPTLKPASKDDAKAAAALNSLDSRGDEIGNSGSSADNAALAGAMSNLKMEGAAADSKKGAKSDEPKKKIKVDAKDVALLVEHCELTKGKATDLLRAHEGSVREALVAWIEGTT